MKMGRGRAIVLALFRRIRRARVAEMEVPPPYVGGYTFSFSGLELVAY